jgi:hypothetical protein
LASNRSSPGSFGSAPGLKQLAPALRIHAPQFRCAFALVEWST